MNLSAAYSTNFHPLKPWFSATENPKDRFMHPSKLYEGIKKIWKTLVIGHIVPFLQAACSFEETYPQRRKHKPSNSQ